MTDQPSDRDTGSHWERIADEWTVWARTPGHDAYWSYRHAFHRFLPPAGHSTLEIGCGEGRIARDLAQLGHQVTATDLALSLVIAAQVARSGRHHLVADAAALPFPGHSFDRVVAYNVMMDVPDMPAAIAEAARVLTVDGVLTLSIVHPFTDRGRFTTTDPDAPFTITGTYYGRSRFSNEETRDGHVMHWAGWSHPLQDYTAALRDAGLAVTDLHEPRPDTRDPALRQWQRLPLFLWINAAPAP